MITAVLYISLRFSCGVFLLVNQVLTGIQVGSYYIVSIDVALSSVDYLMREITYGWSFRYLHSNGAY